MNAPFRPRLPRCPCCANSIYEWRRGLWIEPCRVCRRPLVLFRSPLDWRGPLRLRSLFDLASAAYGLAMIALATIFVTTNMTPLGFARALSVLLFVIGSLLCVDGVLSLRTRLDRTWGALRRGMVASVMGAAKVASGAVAMLMVWIGATL